MNKKKKIKEIENIIDSRSGEVLRAFILNAFILVLIVIVKFIELTLV